MAKRANREFRKNLAVFSGLLLALAFVFSSQAQIQGEKEQQRLKLLASASANLQSLNPDQAPQASLQAESIILEEIPNQKVEEQGQPEQDATQQEARELEDTQEQAPVVPPQNTATAHIAELLLIEDSNAIVHNQHQRWPVASITKIMTALVVLDHFQLEDTITVSQTAVDGEGVSGGLQNQDIYTVSDLIAAMMTVSSNDAAMAIANRFGVENFVGMMNEKATEIGMYNTQFEDPVGLSYLNQSTISDLKILAQHVFNSHPEILAYATKTQTILVEHRSSAEKMIGTINEFAQRADFLGGKTGYTDEAKGNLLSIFDTANGPLLVIVLGSNQRFIDSEILLDQYATQTQ